MIFSRDDAAQVRAGKLTAKLLPTTSRLKPDRTTHLRRQYQPHDQDGNPTGNPTTSTVTDHNPDGEPKPVVLTITSIHQLHLDDLTAHDANACGYRTTTALKDAWRAQHPRTEHVKLVRFIVGDIRNRDRYLSRTHGDYTTNHARAIDDLAALNPDDLATITKHAREQDRARARTPIQHERDQIAKSLENIEDILRRNPNRDVRHTVRSLRHQLATLDRKIKAA